MSFVVPAPGPARAPAAMSAQGSGPPPPYPGSITGAPSRGAARGQAGTSRARDRWVRGPRPPRCRVAGGSAPAPLIGSKSAIRSAVLQCHHRRVPSNSPHAATREPPRRQLMTVRRALLFSDPRRPTSRCSFTRGIQHANGHTRAYCTRAGSRAAHNKHVKTRKNLNNCAGQAVQRGARPGGVSRNYHKWTPVHVANVARRRRNTRERESGRRRPPGTSRKGAGGRGRAPRNTPRAAPRSARAQHGSAVLARTALDKTRRAHVRVRGGGDTSRRGEARGTGLQQRA